MSEKTIIIPKKILLEALLRGEKIINTKSLSTTAIGFFFEINNNKLKIQSTDLGNFLIQTIDINETNLSVNFIVDLILLDLIKKLSDDNIQIKIEESRIEIIASSGLYTIPVRKIRFPKKEIEERKFITSLNIKNFQNILKSIMIKLDPKNDNFIISFQEKKIIFKVFNAFRCSYIEILDQPVLFICEKYLTTQLLEDLFKIFESKNNDKVINFYSLNDDIIFETQDVYLVCIKGKMGSFDNSFSISTLYTFKVNLKELKNKVETHLTVSEKRLLLMQFNFKTDLIDIYSKDISTYRECRSQLKGFGPIEPTGGIKLDMPVFSIVFNAAYLFETLSCGGDDEYVSIGFNSRKFIIFLNSIHIIPLTSSKSI